MQHEDTTGRYKMCQKALTLCPIVSIRIRRASSIDNARFHATYSVVSSSLIPDGTRALGS